MAIVDIFKRVGDFVMDGFRGEDDPFEEMNEDDAYYELNQKSLEYKDELMNFKKVIKAYGKQQL